MFNKKEYNKYLQNKCTNNNDYVDKAILKATLKTHGFDVLSFSVLSIIMFSVTCLIFSTVVSNKLPMFLVIMSFFYWNFCFLLYNGIDGWI